MSKRAFTSGFLAGMTALTTLTSTPSGKVHAYSDDGIGSDFKRIGKDIRFAMNEYEKKREASFEKEKTS